MTEGFVLFLRIGTIVFCAVAIFCNCRILYKYHHEMLGSQFLRFVSLVALPASILWGTAETIYYAAPTRGTRVIWVFFAAFLAGIASALPKQYQQQFKSKEDEKK